MHLGEMSWNDFRHSLMQQLPHSWFRREVSLSPHFGKLSPSPLFLTPAHRIPKCGLRTLSGAHSRLQRQALGRRSLVCWSCCAAGAVPPRCHILRDLRAELTVVLDEKVCTSIYLV